MRRGKVVLGGGLDSDKSGGPVGGMESAEPLGGEGIEGDAAAWEECDHLCGA